MSLPSTNGSNGRDVSGRFSAGNAGGPGNPHARRVARLRSLLLNRVADGDLEAIVGALIEKAKGGDVVAAREVLDRCLGKPKQALDMEVVAEERHELGEKSFEEMSDLEIAETIQRGGLELPPILQRKVDMVLAQQAEAEAPHQALKPKKAVRRQAAKKPVSKASTKSSRSKTAKKSGGNSTKLKSTASSG